MPMMSLDPFLQVANTPEITSGLALAGVVVVSSFLLIASERKSIAEERKTHAEERRDERATRRIEAQASLTTAATLEKAIHTLQEVIGER